MSFDAVFQDIGNPYTRMVKVMFYLEDNTMKVIEPKTTNSGLYQGFKFISFQYKHEIIYAKFHS